MSEKRKQKATMCGVQRTRRLVIKEDGANQSPNLPW